MMVPSTQQMKMALYGNRGERGVNKNKEWKEGLHESGD